MSKSSADGYMYEIHYKKMLSACKNNEIRESVYLSRYSTFPMKWKIGSRPDAQDISGQLSNLMSW